MRTAIGAAALAAIALAGVVAVAGGDDATAGIAARVGVVLGAAWLGFPAFERITWRTWLLGTVGVVLLAWRPRSFIVVLPVLALVLRRTPRE